MSVANRAIMAAIGACVQRMGHGDGDFEARAGAMPYLIGADFNSTPEDLVGTGMLDTIGAQVFAPATRRGTCRTASAGRTIDFFVLDAGSAARSTRWRQWRTARWRRTSQYAWLSTRG